MMQPAARWQANRPYLSPAIVAFVLLAFYLTGSPDSIGYPRATYAVSTMLLGIYVMLQRQLHAKGFLSTNTNALETAIEYLSLWGITTVAAWVLALSAQWVVMLLMASSISFIVTQWSRARGRVLHIPFVSAREALLAVVVCCTVTFWTGPIVWQSLLYSGYLPGIQANHLVALLYMGATLFYCARKVAHVLVSNSYSVVKDKSIEMAESPDDLV